VELTAVGLDKLEEALFGQVVGAVDVEGDQLLQVSVLHPVLETRTGIEELLTNILI
jgi:hypothetical protein